MSELFEQPIFKKARRDLAAARDDEAMATSSFAGDLSLQAHDLVCEMDVPMPVTSAEWRRLKCSPESYFVKKVKGAEVKWHELDAEGKQKFQAANEAEVSQWIAQSAVKRAIGPVPQGRMVQMRWVLTYKESGAAKGRIVLIGYQDPDLATMQSAAPTMSKRTRQLSLQYSSVRGWRTLKADVKSAFLQGDRAEEDRNLFAIPVPELARAFGVEDGEAVQVVKACYGVVPAPANWFQCVRKTLADLQFVQSVTDPCLWFRYELTADGDRETVGYICFYVDDFIISGDEQSETWVSAVTAFHIGSNGRLGNARLSLIAGF